VLAVELIFALSIPDSVLSDTPILMRWTEFAVRFFPAVGNFDAVSPHRQAIAFFLSMAPLFLLPKIYIVYRWLNSDYLGTYRHLVISPLTTHQPEGGEFYAGGAQSTKPTAGESGKPRTPFARFVGSVVVMSFCVAATCMYAMWGWELGRGGSTLKTLQAAYVHFAKGGFWMWFEWSYRSAFVALLIAICVCIVRDYVRWVAAQVLKLTSRKHV
jgi:hypothetical protein